MRIAFLILFAAGMNVTFAQDIVLESRSYTVRKGDCCYELCRARNENKDIDKECKLCLKGEGSYKNCKANPTKSNSQVINTRLMCTLSDDEQSVECENGNTYKKSAAVNDSEGFIQKNSPSSQRTGDRVRVIGN